MKQQLLTLLLTCLLPIFASAQYNINGSVQNENGDNVVGATVWLENTNIGTITDGEGYFELNNLRSNLYELKIRFLGYAIHTEKVYLTGNQTVNIILRNSNYLVDTVLVAATRAEANSATAYTNVSKEELDKLNLGQDVPILLDFTPSVVTTSDAGAGIGYTGIRVRGSDATRVNVTLNGIPLNDSESHGTFWVDLPDFASSVENIQIQRGVGTSTNGAGAFGASVNIQTLGLRTEPYAEYNGTYGSFNTLKNSVQFGTGVLKDHFTIDGRLSKITSDGYIDRASSDLKSFFFSAAYHDANNILRLNVFSGKEITFQAWNGVPEELLETNRTFNEFTYDNQVDNYQQDHYQLHYARQISDQLSANIALHYTHGQGYFEQYKEGEDIADYGLVNTDVFQISEGDTALVESSDLIRRRWLDNDFYGFTYALKYQNEKLNATLGGAWNNYVGDHFGEVIWAQFMGNGSIRQRYYDNTGEKSDFNTFLKATYFLNTNLSIFGDIQFRTINYQVDGLHNSAGEIDLETSFNFINPKVGVRYAFSPQQNVYASFSIGNREPNRDNIIDNPEPAKAERLHDLEVGYQYKTLNYALGINGYWMNYKDQLVLTGNLNDVGEVLQQNVDKSQRMGIELIAKVRPINKLEWAVNATFSRNKIDAFTQNTSIFTPDWDYLGDTSIVYNDTDISFSPNIITASTLTYQPLRGLEISWLSKYVGSQFMDNTSNENRKLDAYWVNHLRLGYTFKTPLFKEIGINFMVNNLFNAMYESNGYTYFILFNESNQTAPTNYNFYYPQAGTNFLAGLKVKF